MSLHTVTTSALRRILLHSTRTALQAGLDFSALLDRLIALAMK
ncbi:MAG: hypothetical protein Q3M30_16665 [Candidatus Electrothrix sp. Rat3]|nr:hypothetical protein [Candidatus Electrothrix rattekaaiensis]